MSSRYQFRVSQRVSLLAPVHGVAAGSAAEVLGRRLINGRPEYLVKVAGRAGPCSVEESEISARSEQTSGT